MKPDYTIIRSSRKTLALQIKDGRILVRAPQRATKSQISAFVNEHRDWIEKQVRKQEADMEDRANQKKLSEEELDDLKKQARRVIPERVEFYAGEIGVTYGRITIRSQHTRWGSCSSRGDLNFNCLLMLMPQQVLDCVVVHELCHRKEMNHSAKFYGQVRRVYPEYDRWNSWLKENGSRFTNMLP